MVGRVSESPDGIAPLPAANGKTRAIIACPGVAVSPPHLGGRADSPVTTTKKKSLLFRSRVLSLPSYQPHPHICRMNSSWRFIYAWWFCINSQLASLPRRSLPPTIRPLPGRHLSAATKPAADHIKQKSTQKNESLKIGCEACTIFSVLLYCRVATDKTHGSQLIFYV